MSYLGFWACAAGFRDLGVRVRSLGAEVRLRLQASKKDPRNS